VIINKYPQLLGRVEHSQISTADSC